MLTSLVSPVSIFPASLIPNRLVGARHSFVPVSNGCLFSSSQQCHFNPVRLRKPRSRSLVVTRAGPPSATTLLFAFLFPLSLLLATIFASIRISDKLDQDFLEEIATSDAFMNAEENEEEIQVPPVPDPAEAVPRTRNRPRREA
ncbi:hypothetical protein H6P81_004031 [Aristolochia fimbriata]|uniref:Uncharacterized protein n=1 Tax=Aristolochia fimbriata TaxID=158543 RepID=A0AAV7FF32_ARIFI|nr:hypothetical protein H6P81_004031 [Aristolochia fimbriata]